MPRKWTPPAPHEEARVQISPTMVARRHLQEAAALLTPVATENQHPCPFRPSCSRECSPWCSGPLRF